MSDHDTPTETDTPACYLHPKREALMRCSRCERPICSDDAIDAPVGYQCPKCAEGGAPVRRLVDVANAAPLTRALVYVIGGLYVLTMAVPGLVGMFGLRPILLAPGGPEMLAAAPGYSPSTLALLIGEPWLLITSAFLHANLMHVGFNGLLLWQLGHMLEPTLGRSRFASLYLAGLAGGGLGVVLIAWASTLAGAGDLSFVEQVLGGNPLQLTIGASGAVFGLMGAAMVNLRARGINPWKTSIGTLVLLNLVITFVIPQVSVGGHVGGLLGGALAGKLLMVDRDQATSASVRVAAIAVGMLVSAVALASVTLGLLAG